MASGEKRSKRSFAFRKPEFFLKRKSIFPTYAKSSENSVSSSSISLIAFRETPISSPLFSRETRNHSGLGAFFPPRRARIQHSANLSSSSNFLSIRLETTSRATEGSMPLFCNLVVKPQTLCSALAMRRKAIFSAFMQSALNGRAFSKKN